MTYNIKTENIALPNIKNGIKSENARLNAAFDEVIKQFPTVNGNRLVLPAPSENGFCTELYGTGNSVIVSKDGAITEPLEDITVNLFYSVIDVSSGESLHSDSAVVIKIYARENTGKNKKPAVLPSVREWRGGNGEFVFSGVIICEDDSLLNAAKQFELYISEMTGSGCLVKNRRPSAGDIVLKLCADMNVGDEGYTVKIGEITEVCAVTPKGIIYAGATIAQILMQSGSGLCMPIGIIRDYPQYPFRSCMIDTARYYMDIKYLTEVTKYAGFFKLNHIHLHLNDGAGEMETTFRLESEKYPELNRTVIEKCEDGRNKLYTKKDWIAYQKEALEYGVEVIPEIDSPSHCGAIGMASQSKEAAENGFENIALNSWQLDLRGDMVFKTAAFVQSVIDEYTDKSNPVFLGKKLHIGTDEWIRNSELENYGLTAEERNEYMRKYMDIMIKYVNSKGYEPVLWSGLNSGTATYAGKTPISKDALFQTWALSFADVDLQLRENYSFINSNDIDLYIVPGGSYYKRDLNVSEMYDTWYAGKFGPDVSVDEGHPLLLGAETAFWLDVSCAGSNIDTFKLLKNQIVLVCEKTWYGDKTEGQTAKEYMSRIKRLANYAAGANPGRYVKANNGGVVLDYDFTGKTPLSDLSGNGYNAENNDLLFNNGLRLDGEGFVSTSLETVSNPMSLEMKLCISSDTAENAVMLESRDGTVYFNYNGTGKIAFKRKGYTYIFATKIPTDIDITVGITCDERNTSLCIDGTDKINAELLKCEYEYIPAEVRTMYTLQLPVKRLFGGIKGTVYSFKVKQ